LPATLRTTARPEGFDYLIDLNAMLDPHASGMAEKHQLARTCREAFPGLSVREVSLQSASMQAALRQVDNAWHVPRRGNGHSNNTSAWEHRAFLRCLDFAGELHLTTLAAFDSHGAPLGFIINEQLPDSYYMAHFGKTLPGYAGLSELLELESARVMREKGCRVMNFQEDHDNPGLRRLKLGWGPSRMLRVFDVRFEE
jgi:hypothetical protein